MMMKLVFWWRKPEYPEETTDLRQVTDETFHIYVLCPVRGLNLGRMEMSYLNTVWLSYLTKIKGILCEVPFFGGSAFLLFYKVGYSN